MDLLKALQQTMMPGNRIPRVGSWDELKQYPMPVDCEGVFIDRDPNKDYIYMKRADANGGEVCARYRITEDPVQDLAAAQADKVRLQGQIDNRDQTQTLLNTLGRFVAWAGSGAQTASAAG